MSYLRVRVTPADFKDIMDTLREYGITSDINISCIYGSKYLLIDTDTKDIKYILDEGYRVFGTEDIFEAKEDFFLLPDEVKKKAFENSDWDIISLLKNPLGRWFSWGNSPEGYQFWYNWEKTINQRLSGEIKVSKKFDEWYTTSPIESIPIDTHDALYEAFEKCRKDYAELIEDKLKLYNKEDYESRLQKQEDPLRRGNSGKPIKLHTGKHKARVAVQHLGYKKVIGRG